MGGGSYKQLSKEADLPVTQFHRGQKSSPLLGRGRWASKLRPWCTATCDHGGGWARGVALMGIWVLTSCPSRFLLGVADTKSWMSLPRPDRQRQGQTA